MANDLRLPEVSTGTVPPQDRVSSAWERTGGAIEQAAGKASGLLYEASMAQTAVQSQEAALQTTKGINSAIQVIRDNPYVSPEWVKAAFGGNVPAGVRLTESTVVPGQDAPVEQDRKVIPMHEVAPHLFEQQAKVAVDNAANGIEAKGFSDKFRQAAAADVEKARQEVFDWQRAQMHADAQIRTTSQLQQAAASRNWNLYEAILNTPQNLLDVKTREELRAQLTRLKTQANVEDRLRSRDTGELNSLLADVAANKVGEAKLSAEEQLHFTTAAHARIREIEHEEDRAEKKAADARMEAFGDKVQQAVNVAAKNNVPLSSLISVTDIPVSLKFHEFTAYKNFLDSMGNRERKTDNRVWAELSDIDKNGGLSKLSRGQMMSYWPGLSEGDQRTWMDRWAKSQEGGGAAKPMFTELEDKTIDRVLEGHYKLDPKKDPDGYNTAKALAQRNLHEWKTRHPDEPLLYDTVRTELRGTTFNASADGVVFGLFGANTQKKWMNKYFAEGEARDALLTLNIGLRAARPGQTVSEQDFLDHVQKMEGEKPTVAAAWQALNPATSLDGTMRAMVHSVLINPTEMKRVDAELAAANQPANEKNRIYRIVQDMQIPQSKPAADKMAADVRAEAERKQVQAAGKELAQKRAEETSADKAAREAAARGERERFAHLPYWGQRAELDQQHAWEAQESDLHEQVRGRVYAEDYARQIAALNTGSGDPLKAPSGGARKYAVGNRQASDPVRIEMDKRIDAEVAAGRAGRRTDFDAKWSEAKGAYRKYYEANMVNEDGSVRTFAPPGFIDNMDAYLAARREGKVR